MTIIRGFGGTGGRVPPREGGGDGIKKKTQCECRTAACSCVRAPHGRNRLRAS